MQSFVLMSTPETIVLTFPQNPSGLDDSMNDLYQEVSFINGDKDRAKKEFDNRPRTMTWEKINYVRNAAFLEALEGFVINNYGKNVFLRLPDNYKAPGNMYEIVLYDFLLEYNPEILNVARVSIKYLIVNASIYNY